MQNEEQCPHTQYCVLRTVYQKPYCTLHYAKQCIAKSVYDNEDKSELSEDDLENLLDEK